MIRVNRCFLFFCNLLILLHHHNDLHAAVERHIVAGIDGVRIEVHHADSDVRCISICMLVGGGTLVPAVVAELCTTQIQHSAQSSRYVLPFMDECFSYLCLSYFVLRVYV